MSDSSHTCTSCVQADKSVCGCVYIGLVKFATNMVDIA